MPNRSFGDFHEAVCRDTLRPALGYGVVFRGRMVCTNAHIMICNSLSLWMEDSEPKDKELLTVAEQLENVEGKAFSFDLLKNLTNAKIKKLRFEADEIIAYDSKGDVFKQFYYSGVSFARLGYERLETKPKSKSKEHLYIAPNNERDFNYFFHLIDEFTGKLKSAPKEKETDPDVPDFMGFPLWVNVLPPAVFDKATYKIKFEGFEKPSTPHHFLNAELLYKISKTFINLTSNVVLGYVAHNRPMIVFPNERDFSDLDTPYGDEFAIIMPIVNSYFNQ